ncbi:zinc ABC transporter substrate-binding protein [Bacillus sp. V3B]|uniref:metal ABC transporter solute-binding protein, Zn/Mn family n=1 Tax=Bacillus sp. V3B TaxID=2804915 RepID=UPI00210EA6DF|nr:zinc ABC transporter substrate-binding protein [Bacillus sp. V3B]MCQ6275848.1 zinc ABC transporter substrate-binding protein [Bacillus sp. V3B]
MKLKYLSWGFILVLSIFLAGCNTQSTPNENVTETQQEEAEQLKVYTTLYPLEDFIKKIGGAYVDVESIMPSGVDAHTFEPTTKQMTTIAEADAFIYNGLGLEPFAEKMAKALENEKVKMVEATHDIETIVHGEEHGQEDEQHSDDAHADEEEHSDDAHAHEEEEHSDDAHAREEEHSDDAHGHDHGDFDPHVWLDPYRSIMLAENIKNTLVELKPNAKEEFEKNYESLKAELQKLDEEFHQLVDSKENPEMIVSHAAYGYWEESYGIHQIAIAGLAPTDEPSQKDLKKIIDIANEKQIKYILFEQNVTPKVAEIIRKEINAEPLYLHNLEALTEEDRQNGEDYFSLMRKNLETLDKALK